MKKTYITLFAFAGVAMGAENTAIFDFGETASSESVSITLDGTHGTVTTGDNNWIIGVSGASQVFGQNVTWALTTVNKNHNEGFGTTSSTNQYTKPFAGELLGSFAGKANVSDAIHMQTWGTDPAYMVLTLTGLEAGQYTLEVFGGFTGQGGMSNVTLTNNGTQGMDFAGWTTMGMVEEGTTQVWTSMGSSSESGVTINVGVDGVQSGSTDKNLGYYIASGDGAVTVGEDGMLSFILTATQVTGDEINWRDLTLSGVALTKIPAANDSVPEPATATLSLLALAGLAARRRRK